MPAMLQYQGYGYSSEQKSPPPGAHTVAGTQKIKYAGEPGVGGLWTNEAGVREGEERVCL